MIMNRFYAAFAALVLGLGVLFGGVGYAAAQEDARIDPGGDRVADRSVNDRDVSEDEEAIGEIKDSDRCSIAGSVYVAVIGTCVFRMTDPKEVRKFAPDRGNDPKCVGKPNGFRYDEQVIDPANPGRRGIVHRVCGARPS